MGFILAPIEGQIILDPAAAVKAELAVEDGARRMKQGVEQQSQAASDAMGKSFKNALKDINSEFGKRSLGGQLLKLAAGGGAIAGLGLAGHEFEALGESVAKAADAMREQDASAKDVAAGFVRDIPILGSFIKGWDGLRDAVTGEAKAMADDAKYVKTVNDAMDAHKVALEANKRATRAYADELANLGGRLAVLRAPDVLKGLVQNEQSVDALRRSAKDELDAASPKNLKELETAASNARAKVTSLRDKFANPPEEGGWRGFVKSLGPFGGAIGMAISSGDDLQGSLNQAIAEANAANLAFNDAKSAGKAAKAAYDAKTGIIDSISKEFQNQWDIDRGIARWNSQMEDIQHHNEHARKMLEADQAAGAAVNAEFGDPRDAFAARIALLTSLRKKGGLDGIDDATFERAREEAVRELNDKLGIGLVSNQAAQAEDVIGKRTVTGDEAMRPLNDIADSSRRSAAGIETLERKFNQLQSGVDVVDFGW